ncbi:MAG: GNAT family N-acetyltransferase [Clostridiaceae bacterium]
MHFYLKKNAADEAISVMREVAAWGRANGFRAWKDEWLTKEELVREEAPEEDFCVGLVDSQPACCMILQWVDTEYWPEAPKYEAGYLHKVCVRRAYAGKGLVSRMVDCAEEEATARGARFLRLDTGWEMAKVRALYEALGFKLVQKLEFPNGCAMALYELEI